VLKTLDGKRRDDSVKAPKRGQRLVEVVLYELDALVIGEALACRREHEFGEVKSDTKHLRTIDLEQREQAAIARPEVEDPPSVERHMLEQDAVSLCATRILIRPAEIATDVLGIGPFLRGHAFVGLAGDSPVGRHTWVQCPRPWAPHWRFRV
jgi:hypothetical protein